MSERVTKRLLDALAACESIQRFLGATTLAEYEENYGLQLQTERLLEIVGEALRQASHVEPRVRQDIPDLGEIIGLRNKLIHGYDGIDEEIVWTAAAIRTEELKVLLKKLIAERSASDSEIN
jgi:uncharacterized protein with HEPN domain